jgi:hypothetical protein
MSVFSPKVLLIALLLPAVQLGAQQTRQNSPYSRFGLGDLLPAELPAQQGMGGVSTIYSNSYMMNVVNPASLGWLNFTDFEAGAYFRTASLSETETGKTSRSNDGNFANLLLGFPILNKPSSDSLNPRKRLRWGMALGLQPHSAVGYDIQVPDSVAGAGRIVNTYLGRGTHYQFLWSNGFRYKNFSVGLGLGYLFGRTNRTSRIVFQENSTEIFTSNFRENENMRAITYNLGLLGEIPLEKAAVRGDSSKMSQKPFHWLVLGATGSAGSTLNYRAFTQYDRSNAQLGVDTVLAANDTTYSRSLPATFSIGIGLRSLGARARAARRAGYDNNYPPYYLLGVQFDYARWNTFGPGMSDAYRVALGGEWSPSFRNPQRYLRSIVYRLGAFYATDPRTFGEGTGSPVQLRRYGASFGLGMPIIPKQKDEDGRILTGMPSFLNLSLEVGRFGHPDLIDEFYFRLGVGLTLNDAGWFRRAKFR